MIQYSEYLIYLIFILCILGLKKFWRMSDHKRIRKYVNNLGGEHCKIRELSVRVHLYEVQYTKDNETVSKTVHFGIFQDCTWY